MIDGLYPSSGDLLEPEQLGAVAARVATRPELWRPHYDPEATERTFVALHRDETVDVWAIFWLPESDTGWHDHDISSGAVHVVEGALEEHVLRLAQPERRTRHPAGSSFTFVPSHIHRITCAAPRAASIHAYSPPLWRLGQYTLTEDGALRRVSVSYADELRPLKAAAA
jgi:predicted metal-dependent enzyme (double-stranded beta helix superfamily)